MCGLMLKLTLQNLRTRLNELSIDIGRLIIFLCTEIIRIVNHHRRMSTWRLQ